MADFNEAFELLKGIEFSSAKDALHKNKGENGYTFMGIYQKYHKDSVLWENLKKYKEITSDIKELSKLMFNNIDNLNEVRRIYKKEYWDKARLDDIQSQKIANTLFYFGINAGIKKAIKFTQRILKVAVDGIVGNQTIDALNNVSEEYFLEKFKEKEKQYYINLAMQDKKYKRFLNGWLNRVEKV